MQPVNRIVADTSPSGNILANIHQTISELLKRMDDFWDSLPKRPLVDSVLALSDIPISLQRHGRRHALLFMLKKTRLSIDIPGIGQFIATLKPGWNDLSTPEGTRVALISGEVSALYRCTDTLA